ncbi:unnamed protein product [Eruca vesicaria subsp. sativa]|uniref:Uncharacterized protein n=1 Tax=Eruca vesicaria subsp. sativa TaxID=29727 RepID=A0ABC8JMR1_ERUVS|nr:unnamed protein product [Eruca vesicaria subsp. sativa]
MKSMKGFLSSISESNISASQEGFNITASQVLSFLGFSASQLFVLLGLTEKFKEKVTGYSSSAIFTYESFILTVLPFLIA